MMRIKNEARWIERVIHSMLPTCEHIFILDDHSTDGTQNICASFPQVALIQSPFEGTHEDRDKNYLLGKVQASVPRGTWVLSIDGDEELASGSETELRRLASATGPDAYRFQVLYLWDSPQQMRTDRLYSQFWRPSFFRLRDEARFRSTTAGGFHCGNVPAPQRVADCGIKILHYGYLYREDRIRKWNFYNSIDPKNRAEGYDPRFPERRSYPHIVQGDIPEVPADAVLMHAGPLELAALTAS